MEKHDDTWISPSQTCYRWWVAQGDHSMTIMAWLWFSYTTSRSISIRSFYTNLFPWNPGLLCNKIVATKVSLLKSLWGREYQQNFISLSILTNSFLLFLNTRSKIRFSRSFCTARSIFFALWLVHLGFCVYFAICSFGPVGCTQSLGCSSLASWWLLGIEK